VQPVRPERGKKEALLRKEKSACIEEAEAQRGCVAGCTAGGTGGGCTTDGAFEAD